MADVRRESRQPNLRFRDARLRLRSPSGSGRHMSRQELADAVNSYLWETYSRTAALDGNYVGKLERGDHRWPQSIYREAFRAVLGASTDTEIGFYINRREPTAEVNAPVPFRGPGTGYDADISWRPDWGEPDILRLPSLLGSAACAVEEANGQVLATPAGRFFDGQTVESRVVPATDDGRILATVPTQIVDSRFLRTSRHGVVIGVAGADGDVRGFVLDSRQARRRLAGTDSAARLLLPPAYLLDDVTAGILWAVVSLDEPLLGDDSLLVLQQQ